MKFVKIILGGYMKKGVILFSTLILLTGCGKGKVTTITCSKAETEGETKLTEVLNITADKNDKVSDIKLTIDFDKFSSSEESIKAF